MQTLSILSKAFIDKLFQDAKDNFAHDGYLTPVLFMVLSSGKLAVQPLKMPHTSEEKRRYFLGIGQQLRARGQTIQEAVFLSEIWFVSPETAPGAMKFAPSQHPSRQEAVVVIGRNAHNTSATQVIYRFTRDANKRPVWEECLAALYEQPAGSGNRAVGLIDYLFDV